jgi:diguanylate cyclase (GGDEF)-like protein
MSEYGDLSDRERRKLYRDFSKAAKEIKVDGRGDTNATSRSGKKAAESDQRQRSAPKRFLFDQRRRKRPTYAVRLKIESYAYSEGFEISGIRQFFSSLFSFLWPSHDPISRGFLKSLVLDSAYRGDPEGYSLIRTLLELQKGGQTLLKGGGFLLRDSDSNFNLRDDLTRDLLNWEPAGYRLLMVFEKLQPRLMEALEGIRGRFDTQKTVNVFELTDVVKGVYRITLSVQADPEVLQERIDGAGELIKGLYKRIYSNDEKIHQVCTRIDQQIADFLACYTRLKWFAGQLYPALLKMLNLFRTQGEVASILGNIYSFVGLDQKEVLVLQASQGPEPKNKPRSADKEAQVARSEEPDRQAGSAEELSQEQIFNFNEEFRGILTILDYAFPGCRAQLIGEGDYSVLLWFHQKIISHRDYRGPLVSRRPDFTDLLWKISLRDPLAPVIVFHELIGQMLESLNPEAVLSLVDPIRGQGTRGRDSFMEIRRQWRSAREELLLRYLKEVDYFEKEISLRGQEVQNRFLSSSAGRKTIETINQIRNHIIRGYGHVALSMDRKEYFRCRPLYAVVKDLYEFLSELAIGRDQLSAKNPVALQRFERDDLVELQPGPVMNQIQSYIEALPENRKIIDNPEGEKNRVLVEILFGFTEILDFLLNDERSALKQTGPEVIYAATEERKIRNEIDNDQTPLRVDLKKDFEEVDRLTGMFSKNEYLRFMPTLFLQSQQTGQQLSLVIMDLDRFKAINDTLGHDFGDEILKLAAEVILSSGREEDLAVRFGGDEILVVIKGNAAAALGQAERIRSRYVELLQERFASQLEEIPALMAQKELVEKKKTDPLYRGGLEDFLERWKGKGLGTLSVGVAQGLGQKLKAPSKDEKELFRRADKILYLAKDSGGNRTVAMFDTLEIPLTAAEYSDFMEYLEQIPDSERSAAAKLFVDLRLAHDQAPLFWNYPYQKYLQDS